MAKFCISCGAQLEDDAGFCTSCGTQQNAQQPDNNVNANASADAAPQSPYSQTGAAQPAGQQPQSAFNQQGSMNMNNFAQAAGNVAQSAGAAVKNTFDGVSIDSVKGAMSIEDIKNVGKTKNKNTIIGLAAIGVVVLILIIILASLLSRKPYEKPISNLFTAIEKTDGEALENAFPDYRNEFIEDNMDDKYDSVAEYYEDYMLEDIIDELEDEYGDNIKITYKVVKKKDIKSSEIKKMKNDIEDIYDEKVDIDKGYSIKLKLKVKGKEDKDERNTWIDVYKIDGKWCVDGLSSMF